MDAKKIMAIAIVAILVVAGVGALFLLNDDEDAELRVSYLKKSAYETQIIADSIDAFSDYDLDVESVPISGSGSDSVNLLLAGEVDIANTGEGPVASAIKKHGSDIVIVCAANVYTGGQVWVASPEMSGSKEITPYDKTSDNKNDVKTSFENAKDALGRPISIGVQQGSTTESEVKAWMKYMGISFNDIGADADTSKLVTLSNIKANLLPSTMSNKGIDILAASQPYPDNTLKTIPGSYVIGTNADIDSYGLSVYITTKDIYIEKNAEIKRFVSALKDATDYMVDPDNYEECTETCAEVCGTDVSTFESAWSISEFQIGWTDKMADVLHNTCQKKGVDVTLEFCKGLCPSELKGHMDSL